MRSKEVDKAKGWFAALDINSEYEATNKEIILNYISELEKDNERLQRNKKIVLEKLAKVINGLENDFPIMLGEQQPLWEENTTKYISKQVIIDKMEEYRDKRNRVWIKCESYHKNEGKIEVLKELLEGE